MEKARRKNRQKHGANWQRISIHLDDISDEARDSQLKALNEALQRFEQEDSVACELVKLRYFTGLSLREASQVLELAPRTADRLWAYAKAWLLREIQRGHDDSS